MNHVNVVLPRDKVAEFCRRHYIRRLSLFGSVLRDDFRPESDIDVLVEFQAGCVPGFFGLLTMEGELADGRDARRGCPGGPGEKWFPANSQSAYAGMPAKRSSRRCSISRRAQGSSSMKRSGKGANRTRRITWFSRASSRPSSR